MYYKYSNNIYLYIYFFMDKLDLNVENYTYDDILNLFQLDYNFTFDDLKKCKKKVIITGAVTAIQQGSSANNLPASSTFDFNNKMTGISGTVVGVTLTYDAGETIYGATIDFQPLDFIAGL